MAAIIREDMYTMTRIGENNNKYWKIIQRDDFSCQVEFGRIGYDGQSKTHQFANITLSDRFYTTKSREKVSKGYSKQEVIQTKSSTVKVESNQSLKMLAESQIESNSEIVKALIRYLSEKNIHNILSSTTMTYNIDSGLFSTPIGIVSKASIDSARTVLAEISNYVLSGKLKEPAYHSLLEKYLTLIPQNVGMRLRPESLYTSQEDLTKQNDILDALDASLISVQNVVESPEIQVEQPKIFDVKLFHVEDAAIIDRITKKYKSTLQRMHSSSDLKVKTVYSVEMPTMKSRFELTAQKLGNVKELWHGTRVSNVLSILKQGLVIPPSNAAHVCGRLYGNGVYFSDIASKSLNYSFGYWDGKAKDNNCFMFLADVAMGKEFTPTSSHTSLPKPGYDSTYAVGGKSGVINNEMIVYSLNQINLTYLVEFTK